MRLPFPERISLFSTFVFCTILCGLQQLNGTSALFSICTFLFVFLGTMAFNITGGFNRPSGAFIFSWVVIAGLLGLTYKVILGEPGQSNLLQPERTIEVFASGSFALLIAAYFNSKIRTKRSFLPKFASDSDMRLASIGCLIVGGVAQVIFLTVTVHSGSLLSAFGQLNEFLPLGLLLGVTSEIRRSGGRRSINIPTFLICLIIFLTGGILSYSKQGMFSPFACWAIAAAAQRYKVSVVQIATLLLSLGFITYYLVPYSQAGRASTFPGITLQQTVKNNIYFLTRLPQLRKLYNEDEARRLSAARSSDEIVFNYYNEPQGLMDRLHMISPDDAIINATETGGPFGIEELVFDFENLIPHAIWPGKPTIDFGNVYAHEVGIIGDPEDTTTGVSFSPSGDLYHQAGWIGVLGLMPLLGIMLFFIIDSLCGTPRESPICLLAMVVSLHSAPEGGSGVFVGESTFLMLQLFFVGWISAFLMPRIAHLFIRNMKKPAPRTSMPINSRVDNFTTESHSQESMLQPTVLSSPYRWSGRT